MDEITRTVQGRRDNMNADGSLSKLTYKGAVLALISAEEEGK